jgi:hypothetical protein
MAHFLKLTDAMLHCYDYGGQQARTGPARTMPDDLELANKLRTYWDLSKSGRELLPEQAAKLEHVRRIDCAFLASRLSII